MAARVDAVRTGRIELKEVLSGPDGRFSGYASLFGVTDLANDQIEAGAFRASLERRGAGGIKLLYQHDPGEPIGRWLQIKEDGKGLHVFGELQLEVAKAREVLALMKAGILDGLSIGFRTVRARTEAKSGIRKVAEVDLWEISIVTFPMLPGARVTGIGREEKAGEIIGQLHRAARVLRGG